MHRLRPPGRQRPEAGIQPIHSFPLRQPSVIYAAFLGVAFGAVLLSGIFLSGVVDVGLPRWLWLLDGIVVVTFLVDHFRVAAARRRAPTASMVGVGVLIAGALTGLTLVLCW